MSRNVKDISFDDLLSELKKEEIGSEHNYDAIEENIDGDIDMANNYYVEEDLESVEEINNSNKEESKLKEEILQEVKEADEEDLRIALAVTQDIKIRNVKQKKFIVAMLNDFRETGEDLVICDKLYHLAASGIIRREIKKAMKINSNVWNEMMRNKHLPYLEAITEGEKLGLFAVRDSLKSRALGYDVTEIEKGIKNDKPYYSIKRKHIPADIKAIMYYLEKTDPETYNNVQKSELKITHENVIDYKNLTPDKLKELKQMLLIQIQQKNKEAREIVSEQ